MSMHEVGSELHAVSQALPREVIIDALTQLETVEARYAFVLDGSGADITDEIRGGLADVQRSLQEASERLKIVRESTARYLASIGLGEVVDPADPAVTPELRPALAMPTDIGPVPETVHRAGLTFAALNDGKPHTVARTQINAKLREVARTNLNMGEIARVPVPDELTRWDVPAPEYTPPFIDIPRVVSSARKPDDYTDLLNPALITQFTSITGEPIARDTAGRPLNPAGRTGMSGRGLLNKWGENPAADIILTRENPETGELEVAAIQRVDTGEWALPGGKVDPGETARQTARREFYEEAGGEGVELEINQAREVYVGYVDDSRNTDNAWMVSTAFHLHLEPEDAQRIVLSPSTDAQGAAWVPASTTFFASHGKLVERAIREHRRTA